ncbi:hypothetical protein EV1_008214 [Malus domestica]
MAGSGGGELRAPVFNGENFDFWQIRMKTIFRSHELWNIVENSLRWKRSCGVKIWSRMQGLLESFREPYQIKFFHALQPWKLRKKLGIF